MMAVPQTAFSLLYHATSVSPYRREAHEDLLVSFERFAIVDGAVRKACTRMENASYELRASSVDAPANRPVPSMAARYRAARAELDSATTDLFKILERDFAWFLSSYAEVIAGNERYRATGRLRSPSQARSLLELVYHCLYVPEFAKQLVATGSDLRNVRTDELTLAAVLLAAHTVDAARSLPPAQAGTTAETLCNALAEEYRRVGWLDCW